MHVQGGNIRVRDVNHGELFGVFICPMTHEDYIPPLHNTSDTRRMKAALRNPCRGMQHRHGIGQRFDTR